MAKLHGLFRDKQRHLAENVLKKNLRNFKRVTWKENVWEFVRVLINVNILLHHTAAYWNLIYLSCVFLSLWTIRKALHYCISNAVVYRCIKTVNDLQCRSNTKGFTKTGLRHSNHPELNLVLLTPTNFWLNVHGCFYKIAFRNKADAITFTCIYPSEHFCGENSVKCFQGIQMATENWDG